MTQAGSPVRLPDAITVKDLADLLGVTSIDVIKELMKNGVMATINQVVDFDTAAIVASDFGFVPEEANAPPDTRCRRPGRCPRRGARGGGRPREHLAPDRGGGGPGSEAAPPDHHRPGSR